MKKFSVLLLLVALTAALMVGCGKPAGEGQGSENAPDPSKVDSAESDKVVGSLKTIGDVIDLDAEEMQSAVTDKYVIYAFKLDDTYYRVISSISAKDSKKYMDIDYADEDFEDQQKKIVSPLPVEKVENLSKQILSKEELDKLAGKTGKDLVKEGWSHSGTFTLDDMTFEMNYGPMMYGVTFDGDSAGKEAENYDPEKETADMTVKSVVFHALGDNVTNIE